MPLLCVLYKPWGFRRRPILRSVKVPVRFQSNKVGFFFYFVLCTINSQNITLPHVSTLSCHLKGICDQCLAKSHKYFKCSCWFFNLIFHMQNIKFETQNLHLKYLCDLAKLWSQTPWRWHDSVETCGSVIFCELLVHLSFIVQNNKRCTVHTLK